MRRVLLIEDNEELAFGITAALRQEDIDVRQAGTGNGGLALLASFQPQAVILDLGLPDIDGFAVLRQLRRIDRAVPVLILTARGEEDDVVRGLELGADDYVTKPITLAVLRARTGALLRRVEQRGPDAEEIRFGEIAIDARKRRVSRRGEPVELSPKEFDLLMALWHREGAVASRLALLQEVWNYAPGVRTRTVDIHIRQLRAKIEPDQAEPRHIITVWGVGYRLEP